MAHLKATGARYAHGISVGDADLAARAWTIDPGLPLEVAAIWDLNRCQCDWLPVCDGAPDP